jgi:F0F1-type ATP synthase membrane subunit b/b'
VSLANGIWTLLLFVLFVSLVLWRRALTRLSKALDEYHAQVKAEAAQIDEWYADFRKAVGG